MDKERKAFFLTLFVFAVIIFVWVILPILDYSSAHAEDNEATSVYVTASMLNGRSDPRKSAYVAAKFDRGDKLDALNWSRNHNWVEVKGGETGTVWVWWEYVTERTDEYPVYNDYGSRIKIRNKPHGRVVGYLKKNEELFIDKVLFGWGHSDKGWIELKYVTEED